MGRKSVEVSQPHTEVSLKEKLGDIFESGNLTKDLLILDLKTQLEAKSLSESDLRELEDKLRFGAEKFNEKWMDFRQKAKNLPPAHVMQVKETFKKRSDQLKEMIGLVRTELNRFRLERDYQQINEIVSSSNIDSQNVEGVLAQVEQLDKQNPVEALRYFEAIMYEGYEKLSEEEKTQRMKILKAIHRQRLVKENFIRSEQNAEAIAKNPYVDEYSDRVSLKWSDIKGMLEIDENKLAYFKEKNETNDFDLSRRSKSDKGGRIEAQVAHDIVQYIPDVLCVIQSPRFSNADNVDKIDLIVVRKNPSCSDVSETFLMQGLEILKGQIEKQDEAVRVRIGLKNKRTYDNDYGSIIHTRDIKSKNNEEEADFPSQDLSYYFEVQFVQVKTTNEGLKGRKITTEGVGWICWNESYEKDGDKQYVHSQLEFKKGVELMLGE
jgi:hypothetical protein